MQQRSPTERRPSGFSPEFLWRVIYALIGGLLVFGYGWGVRSNQLETLSTDFRGFMAAYVVADKAAGKEVQEIQDHLKWQDQRLDKMENQIRQQWAGKQ